MTHLCKVIYSPSSKKVTFAAPKLIARTLEDQIEEDRRYGVMIPNNKKYFTYQILDWKGKFITKKQIVKAITMSWEAVEKEISIDVKRASPDDNADFEIHFRKTADDSELTANTLMYHYFPINNKNNPNRGLCVVNTDWPFTSHGNPISMHEIDPIHYPSETRTKGATIDFDQVYTHEGPGHGLGLPHSSHSGKVMSDNYGDMAEFMFDEEPMETIPRLVAKYFKRPMSSRTRIRWRNFWRHRLNRY